MDRKAVVARRGTFTKLDDAEFKSKKRAVYRGINMEDGVEVLWHIIDIDDLLGSERDVVLTKFEQICGLVHDNIVSVLDFWVDEEKQQLNFITELMSSGSLNEFLSRPGKLGRNTVGRWCTQIVMGLQYLHSRSPHIVHRNINCGNLYFNGNTGQVKIACWDLALAHRNLRSSNMGGADSPEYIAPEMFEDDEPTPLVDVYGFGMCILQLMTKKQPYSECKSTKEVFDRIQRGILPAALDQITDTDIKAMILSCLSAKAHRPSPTHLLNSPFLKSVVPSLIQPSRSEEHTVPPFIQAVDDRDEVSLSHKVIDLAMVSLTIKHQERVIEVHFPYNVKTDTPELVAEDMKKQLSLSDELASKVLRALQKYVNLYTTPFSVSG